MVQYSIIQRSIIMKYNTLLTIILAGIILATPTVQARPHHGSCIALGVGTALGLLIGTANSTPAPATTVVYTPAPPPPAPVVYAPPPPPPPPRPVVVYSPPPPPHPVIVHRPPPRPMPPAPPPRRGPPPPPRHRR